MRTNQKPWGGSLSGYFEILLKSALKVLNTVIKEPRQTVSQVEDGFHMCTPHCVSTVLKTPGSGMLAWRPGMRESLQGPCLAAFPSIPEPVGVQGATGDAWRQPGEGTRNHPSCPESLVKRVRRAGLPCASELLSWILGTALSFVYYFLLLLPLSPSALLSEVKEVETCQHSSKLNNLLSK